MDTVTQIALGAAVGEAVIGRHAGRRALLWGAIAGVIPDLDIFIPFDDPVETFTYHRSFSHSLLFLTALTPALVVLITRLHPGTKAHRARWTWAVWLALITHPLLDCFTVYGTQLFWPFSSYPIMWSTVFIIDLLYTAPLLAGAVCALAMTRAKPFGHRLNTLGLALSAVYLAWSAGAKLYVDRIAEAALQNQRIAYTQLLSVASPLNTVLWRLVAMTGDGYYEGYYSLLDGSEKVEWTKYPSDTTLLEGIEDAWAVRRLQWFTRGFYSVAHNADAVIITDLRMGQEPAYIFSYKIGERKNGRTVSVPSEPYDTQRISPGQLLWVWRRIWDASAVPPARVNQPGRS